MRCPHCNSPVPSGNNTCLDCGRRFVIADTRASQNHQAATATKRTNQAWDAEGQKPPASIRKKKSGGSRLVFTLALVWVFVYMLLGVVEMLDDEDIEIGGLTIGNYEVIYNDDGTYQEEYIFGDDQQLIHYYNAEGEIQESIYYDSDGSLLYRSTYQDDQEASCQYYTDGELFETVYFEYDYEDGQVYCCYEYCILEETGIMLYETYYDTDFNVVGEIIYDENTGVATECWGTDNRGNDLTE